MTPDNVTRKTGRRDAGGQHGRRTRGEWLEHPLQAGISRGNDCEHTDRQPDHHRRRYLVPAAAQKSGGRARHDGKRCGPHYHPVSLRRLFDCFDLGGSFGGEEQAVQDMTGDLVDAGQLAEIGIGGGDTNHVGPLVVLRAKRCHDRCRRREELRLKPELLAGELERLLQAMSSVPRGMQCAAEAQHEADALVRVLPVHSS
ncbi:MAG TPA: hypothetical protein VGM77_01045 [Gemmatimonadales bacterium]|jgi:hypothetical protein